MLELSDKDFRQPSLKFFNKHLQMKKLRKETENIEPIGNYTTEK